MRSTKEDKATPGLDRERLEALFLQLQRERLALTGAIMRLRGASALRRPRIVLGILIALLRLQRANRRAMAAIGVAMPP